MTSDTSGISKLDLKRQNRMHILRLLRNNGPTSRIDIAREIGITKAAVTIITNEMIEQGVLFEKGEMLPRGSKVPRGRKKILLDFDETHRLGLGLVLDNGQLSIGLCTLKGRPVERQAVPLGADCSSTQITAAIREMYEEMAYKNDLKPETVVGMGVCISEEYHQVLGITRDAEGRVDYQAFEKALREFCSLPVKFGSLADGIAMAEMDYHPEDEQPPLNMVVFRCDQAPDCSIITGREIYSGSFERPGCMIRQPGEEDHSILQLHSMIQETFSSTVDQKLEELFASHQAPVLEAQAPEGLEEFRSRFRAADLLPEDAAIITLLERIRRGYRAALECFTVFYAPDRIVYFGRHCVQSAMSAAIEEVKNSFAPHTIPTIRPSIIDPDEYHRAACALATRKFFINKGGY